MAMERRRASVLLVEDDPDYLQLLDEAFRESGFHTLTASNGERALEILREAPVDLVVSDFVMPELNGLELCRILGADERASKARVILYSCNTDATFRRKARDLGALDYLAKTDDADALVRQICETAGLAAEPARRSSGADDVQDRLRSIAHTAEHSKALLDSLLDFTRILAMSDQQTPATRLAWDSVQRTGSDLRRLLEELEAAAENPQVRPEETVSR
jgi:CheY-like chemotaxis protein